MAYAEHLLKTLTELLAIDSPTGMAHLAIDYAERQATELGYPFERTAKGNGVIRVKGSVGETVAACAHVDTLGLMIRSIKPDGKLAVTTVGSPILPTLDGEYCRVYARDGRAYTGTILCTSPAGHVYPDASDKPRTQENLEVRLDEEVRSRDDAQKLGLCAGDFICIDTKTQVTESGFVKSRFLDDKAGVAVLLTLLKRWKAEGIVPRRDVCLLISTYEETGHGMAHLPQGITELLAVDMGCIGLDLSCTEYDVSICAKDSSGPYDYAMTSRLIELARSHSLPHAVDIYPRYGSDASAALRAGNDIRAALIGPGVHASHGMERTHIRGLEAAFDLAHLYLSE